MINDWARLGRTALARHGTIAAYVALMLASSAGAYAANSVGSDDIIDESIQSQDLKDGAAVGGSDVIDNSLTGVQINEGSLVASEFHGADAGVYSGRSLTKAKVTDTNIFLAPSGLSTPVAGSDASVSLIAPATALRARDLIVTESDRKPSDGTRTYIVRVNGADTPLRCHLTGTANTCSNTAASVAVPVGARLSLHLVRSASGTRTASQIQFAWRTVTP